MLEKIFLETKCKVEFSLPEIATPGIQQVYLVGEFNNWNENATPMKKNGKGYKVTLDLPLNREYQFRYLVNGKRWYNDWNADKYVHVEFFGIDNSVVCTYPEHHQ
ncbi:MAG TPA: isoamylase early set domain-containing protein [Aggregatilineales bacterium]|nr:isoamylase early set domain-containing protein [Aggregatilineales bacterium]